MSDHKNIFDLWPNAMNELLNPKVGIELPLWPGFNNLVGGLREHELTLICAPTGAGKTQFNANISAQLVLACIPQYIASVETGPIDYLIRVISSLLHKDLNTGEKYSQEYIKEITRKYYPLFETKNIYFDLHDNRVKVNAMIETLKTMHEKHGVKVAILDNLNFFLDVVSSTHEKAEMDSAIHEFVMLAKKIPIHIILVVHPRKTDNGRVESEFDIKGSSTAVQEASNVFLLNRPTKDDLENGRLRITDRELTIRKLRRRGMNVGKRLFFYFVGGYYLESENLRNEL